MAELIGYVKHQLIRELADGCYSQAALARKYNVTDMAITNFKKRHAFEIEELLGKARDEAELYGLWIAEKLNRVAEYQEDVERINAQLVACDWKDTGLLTAKHRALMRCAEELGDIPTKKAPVKEGNALHYVVEGVEGVLT